MYEPAEAMFLPRDVFKAAAAELTGMEIRLKAGLGSGVISEFLASMIGPLALYMCSAVNPEAAVCTLETVCCNKANNHRFQKLYKGPLYFPNRQAKKSFRSSSSPGPNL